jgi:hypothetical protein
MRALHIALCAALSLSLAACAQPGNFPSLAPRAIEFAGDEEPSRPAAPPVATEAALLSRINELKEQARAGQNAFEGSLSRTSRAAARAGVSGSESWVAAQQELSRLEADRGPTLAALAALDRLTVERSSQATAETDFQTLLAATEEVRALAEGQQAQIDRLRQSLVR